jgi:hypothetical protein
MYEGVQFWGRDIFIAEKPAIWLAAIEWNVVETHIQ